MTKRELTAEGCRPFIVERRTLPHNRRIDVYLPEISVIKKTIGVSHGNLEVVLNRETRAILRVSVLDDTKVNLETFMFTAVQRFRMSKEEQRAVEEMVKRV